MAPFASDVAGLRRHVAFLPLVGPFARDDSRRMTLLLLALAVLVAADLVALLRTMRGHAPRLPARSSPNSWEADGLPSQPYASRSRTV